MSQVWRGGIESVAVVVMALQTAVVITEHGDGLLHSMLANSVMLISFQPVWDWDVWAQWWAVTQTVLCDIRYTHLLQSVCNSSVSGTPGQ